jgi:hypothetical protein
MKFKPREGGREAQWGHGMIRTISLCRYHKKYTIQFPFDNPHLFTNIFP